MQGAPAPTFLHRSRSVAGACGRWSTTINGCNARQVRRSLRRCRNENRSALSRSSSPEDGHGNVRRPGDLESSLSATRAQLGWSGGSPLAPALIDRANRARPACNNLAGSAVPSNAGRMRSGRGSADAVGGAGPRGVVTKICCAILMHMLRARHPIKHHAARADDGLARSGMRACSNRRWRICRSEVADTSLQR